MTPEKVTQAIDQAREALAKQDPRGAFGALRWVLQYPSRVSADPIVWPQVVALFADISERIAGPELAGQLRSVLPAPKRRLLGLWSGAVQPASAQALFEVGYALIEHELHGIAATFLALANDLEPNRERIVGELAIALESAGQHEEARRILESAPAVLASSFNCSYLLAFDTLLTGDVALARERHAKLRAADDLERWMAGALDGMLLRAEALLRGSSRLDPLSTEDLAGWQFVVNGSFLLHRSAFGFEEGMRGRYAYTQDFLGRCHAGLVRLKRLCSIVDFRPVAILSMPNRDSQILALAASELFGVPKEPWREAPLSPGLIIAYDMQGVELTKAEVDALRAGAPGQAYFEHAACWTSPFPVAGDVINYLQQINQAPWGHRTSFDPETRTKTELSADERAPEVIAQELLAAPVDYEDELHGDEAELERLVEQALGLPPDAQPQMLRRSGPRLLQRSDSRVKSNRFG
ncbi:MAG: hypothetical protein IPG45_23255 [Deltaproteobacteria bacterium]|nr:hypothetical protein [Deltaproteobacteria bacterium]